MVYINLFFFAYAAVLLFSGNGGWFAFICMILNATAAIIAAAKNEIKKNEQQ